MDEQHMYRLEYFSVVIDEGGQIPVFLTLADSEEEARDWAERQRVAMLAAAKEEGAELPFDTEKMKLFSRAEFRKLIGVVDLHTAEYAEWYSRSVISYLTYRIEVELEALNAALLSGQPEEAKKWGVSLRKLWINLSRALDSCEITPQVTDHEPDASCFSCADLAECPKGQKYMLTVSPAQKIWN